MSKKDQFNKNIKLSGKLADFLADNPKHLKKYGNSSFVVFTKNDKELNKMNDSLIESLKSEGRKVVKATQTENKKSPWKFEYAF